VNAPVEVSNCRLFKFKLLSGLLVPGSVFLSLA
jgi:hypothetical protein